MSVVPTPGAKPDRPTFSLIPLLALLGLTLALCGCGTRPTADVLKIANSVPGGGKTVNVYVTTTRAPDEAGVGYGAGKALQTRYLEYTISIPPAHKPGKIEYPGAKADPQKEFTVIGKRELDRAGFLNATADRSKREAGVFVHGFNYSFQESLFRLAQMSADAQVDGVPVLFAWPSSAALTGYVADKEAATYSRDALAGLLDDLATKRTSNTVVFAHSMGGWLTMESLRQLRLERKDRALNRLTVVLAAPDIDVDVFRKDMETIGRLPTPITVLVSRDDRALQVSGILSRDQRVGTLDINDPEIAAAAKSYNVALVDISKLTASDSLNHDRYVALASTYGQLGETGKPNGLRQAGAFVFNAVGATVSSPFTLVSTAIAGK